MGRSPYLLTDVPFQVSIEDNVLGEVQTLWISVHAIWLCNSLAVFQPHPPGPAGLKADHISSQYSHQLQAPSPIWRTCAQSWCASGNISMLLNWRNDQVRVKILRHMHPVIWSIPHPRLLTSCMALDKSQKLLEPQFPHHITKPPVTTGPGWSQERSESGIQEIWLLVWAWVSKAFSHLPGFTDLRLQLCPMSVYWLRWILTGQKLKFFSLS